MLRIIFLNVKRQIIWGFHPLWDIITLKDSANMEKSVCKSQDLRLKSDGCDFQALVLHYNKKKNRLNSVVDSR